MQPTERKSAQRRLQQLVEPYYYAFLDQPEQNAPLKTALLSFPQLCGTESLAALAQKAVHYTWSSDYETMSFSLAAVERE